MTKMVAGVLTALSLAAGYATVYDVGVQDASVKKQSVRQGSARGGVFIGGGYRRGK
ncbi:MAG: hypothetical protein AAF493_24195 [Pseudomonadota bacterium]